MRVAYLGPPGTFSEIAALARFGDTIECVACPTFDEVFRVVTSGAADVGVVPVENSSEGSVGRTLDLLFASKLHIVGETSIAIAHDLLRRADGAGPVGAVVAHAQALAQCEAWLNTNLVGVERRAVASNAEGARLAQGDASLAAIASERAAHEYALRIVHAHIEDLADNRTRFVVISDPARKPAPPPSGRDRTSVVVSVPNRPGAVCDLLLPLKEHGVSMTRFESRPSRVAQWEYIFFLDIAGHATEPAVARALAQIGNDSAFYRLLGTYAVEAA